eukprot:4029886-Pyramimonas_sp.AAC.1
MITGSTFVSSAKPGILIVATTTRDPGPTFFGPKGGRNRIDHFAIPQGAAHLVQKCIALHTFGKRLQLIQAKGSRGHVPIGLVIGARIRHVPTSRPKPEHRLDRGQLMSCLRRGFKLSLIHISEPTRPEPI